MPPRRRLDPESAAEVAAAFDRGETPDRDLQRRATRHLLAVLAEKAPGHAVEVRVPPYGAVQCGEGPRHTRGTPPNVVETDPLTWLQLALGRRTFADAKDAGKVSASGNRADLSQWLPV
ncbi:sterol carrier family protein [Fodinicola acaciae]|uniref:sterol carrier family protein n=1 Tax=Fodinicola acaciae TaxID=2681555 RepID=UPI0013D19C56|nr:sterol carrier family protein [Fodinicola acaciae]